MKKFLWLFSLLIVILLFEVCKKEERYGSPPAYFLRTAMKVSHTSFIIKYRPPHDWKSAPFTIDTSSHYFINFDFDVEYIAKAKQKPSSFFVNSAYADQPADLPGYKGAKDSIISIKITSDAAFDSLYIAGTLLNRFFTTFDKLQSGRSDSLRHSHLDNYRESNYIVLATKPTLDSTHTFNIEMITSKGDTFTGKTPPATFLKK